MVLLRILLACSETVTPPASPLQRDAPAAPLPAYPAPACPPTSGTGGEGFVACPTSTMTGEDLPAATRAIHHVAALPDDLCGQLVYYGASVTGVGLLAPPGLSCEVHIGSSGAHLVLTQGVGGPRVGALSDLSTDTSGRYVAALAFGRLLPERDAVIRETEASADITIPRTPFPDDVILRPAPGVARFRTPPRRLGAASVLEIPEGPTSAFGGVVDRSQSKREARVFALSPPTELSPGAMDAIVAQFLLDAGPGDPDGRR